jgi:acyl dehydratase
MPVFADLDALVRAEDVALGHTDWELIDQRRVDGFAELTGDRHWIHVDPARARAEGPFGGTIAHGALSLALCTAHLTRLLSIGSVGMVFNYGTEGARLRSPVPVDSRVRGHGRLLHGRRLGGAVRVTARVTLEVAGARRPACEVDQVVVCYPPGQGPAAG